MTATSLQILNVYTILSNTDHFVSEYMASRPRTRKPQISDDNFPQNWARVHSTCTLSGVSSLLSEQNEAIMVGPIHPFARITEHVYIKFRIVGLLKTAGHI
jgi:hypothetical protein